MLAVMLAGVLGGVIGGAAVGCVLFFWTPRAAPSRRIGHRETNRLTSLSYRLWQLYVAVVSGASVPVSRLRAAHDEVLLVTFDVACEKETEEALLAMTSLLFRAWKRSREFTRVRLTISPAQFSDLTEDMQAAFAGVQLASGRLRSSGEDQIREALVDLGAARLRRLADRRR